MSSYDLSGRSAVLRERVCAKRAVSNAQLQQEVIRLADIAEFELGFETLLHRNLAIVRSRARLNQHLQALDCLDAAIQQFVAEHSEAFSQRAFSG